MALSMLSSLVKPRVGVVVGGRSLLRIGSSMTKRQSVLSNLLSSSSSSSSYDQSSYSSRHTFGLAALGMLIGSSSSNNNNNDRTTHSSPASASASASASAASFISSELIGSAAKIYRYSSPQHCTYGEALEYAGIPRDYANTEACKLRLTRDINIANAHHGAPRFATSREEFKERYKVIFDSIPLSVSIGNKHNRLLRMIGLPLLPPPPFSIMVNGRKEFLPSISTINPENGKKNPSAIAQHLSRKSKIWMQEMTAELELAATTDAAVISSNNNNVLDAATTLRAGTFNYGTTRSNFSYHG